MDVSVDALQWYSTVAGIVGATVFLVQMLKPQLAAVPVIQNWPTWLVTVLCAEALALLSKAAGLLTDDGTWLEISMKAIAMAATASGFWTWWKTRRDAIADSDTARRARALMIAMPLLVIGALAGTGCGGAGRFVPETTPQQGLAYEMREALVHVRGSQAAIMQAVDEGRATVTAVDPFLKAARELYAYTHDTIVPRLRDFDAVHQLGEQTRLALARVELAPLLAQWNTLASRLFGAQLPPGLLEPLTTLAEEVRKSLRVTRSEFRLQLTF